MIRKLLPNVPVKCRVILERNISHYNGIQRTLKTFTIGKTYIVQKDTGSYYVVTSDAGVTTKIGKHYFSKPLVNTRGKVLRIPNEKQEEYVKYLENIEQEKDF